MEKQNHQNLDNSLFQSLRVEFPAACGAMFLVEWIKHVARIHRTGGGCTPSAFFHPTRDTPQLAAGLFISLIHALDVKNLAEIGNLQHLRHNA